MIILSLHITVMIHISIYVAHICLIQTPWDTTRDTKCDANPKQQLND